MFGELDLFNELDRALGIDYNPNLWSDDAIFYVRGLIDQLDSAGWDRLRGVWQVRPVPWQVRLAQAAFAADNLRTIDMLCEMLEAPNVQVALVAAETLNEEAIDGRWAPTPSTGKDLQGLCERAEGEARQTVESLIARIPAIEPAAAH